MTSVGPICISLADPNDRLVTVLPMTSVGHTCII